MKSLLRQSAGEQPRSKATATQRVYNELRRLILHGELEPGTVVTEADFAERLEVSRTPIREALRELLREGLIVEGPRRQIIVRTVPLADRHQLMLLRSALERLAVTEAARIAEITYVDQLRLLVIQQKRALRSGNVQAYLDLDDDFHVLIAVAAGTPIGADFLHQLRGLVRLVLNEQELSPTRLEETVADHEEIIDALEKRAPDAADAAMARHLSRTERMLSSARSDESARAAPPEGKSS